MIIRVPSFALSLLTTLLVTVAGNAQLDCDRYKGHYYNSNGERLTKRQLEKAKADAPLITAVEANDVAAVKAALKKGVDVNAKDCGTETTALMSAIINGNSEIMRILISAKADVNLQNYSGLTALIFAVGGVGVGHNRFEDVKELIEAGADVHAKTTDKPGVRDEHTALSWALRWDKKIMRDIADLLRQHGATK